MQILVLSAFQPVFLQPCADGDVVEFQGRTGYEDGQDKDAGGYHDMGVQRGVRVGVFPVEQHVYQREVGDVERVGEFSEKVAYLLAPEDERTPPESAFHTDEPAESEDEKSAEERIEQSCQAYVYLFRREAPTSDRGVHLGSAGIGVVSPHPLMSIFIPQGIIRQPITKARATFHPGTFPISGNVSPVRRSRGRLR